MAKTPKKKSVFESKKYKLPIKSEDVAIGPSSVALRAGVILRKGFQAAQRKALATERTSEAAGTPFDLEPSKKTPKKSSGKANVDAKGKSTVIKMGQKKK